MSANINLGKLIDAKDGSFDLQDSRPEFPGSVCVLFTSTHRTLKALAKACELAKLFDGRVSVVVTSIIPFPLPLDKPPVPFEFAISHFTEQAGQFPAEISIFSYLCRDRLETLKRVLAHNSIIVISVRSRWWPTRDEILAQKLRQIGYAVLVLETE